MTLTPNDRRYQEHYGRYTIEDIPALSRELLRARRQLRAFDADPVDNDIAPTGIRARVEHEVACLDRRIRELVAEM